MEKAEAPDHGSVVGQKWGSEKSCSRLIAAVLSALDSLGCADRDGALRLVVMALTKSFGLAKVA